MNDEEKLSRLWEHVKNRFNIIESIRKENAELRKRSDWVPYPKFFEVCERLKGLEAENEALKKEIMAMRNLSR